MPAQTRFGPNQDERGPLVESGREPGSERTVKPRERRPSMGPALQQRELVTQRQILQGERSMGSKEAHESPRDENDDCERSVFCGTSTRIGTVPPKLLRWKPTAHSIQRGHTGERTATQRERTWYGGV
jgi:hypothetical protein